jgi:hypothetical protein
LFLSTGKRKGEELAENKGAGRQEEMGYNAKVPATNTNDSMRVFFQRPAPNGWTGSQRYGRT